MPRYFIHILGKNDQLIQLRFFYILTKHYCGPIQSKDDDILKHLYKKFSIVQIEKTGKYCSETSQVCNISLSFSNTNSNIKVKFLLKVRDVKSVNRIILNFHSF